jgi:pantoate--beta-alanine ligase
VGEIYPDGFSTTVHVAGLTDGLCGPLRPGHFDGVATVVSKLLLQCLPDVAVFGEKDYQQLQVIKRMVHDLAMPFEIVGMPTVREADGLAMSSRNRYMSPEERTKAVALYRELNNVAKAVRAGKSATEATRAATEALLAAGFDKVEYLTVTDPDTLVPLERVTGPARVIAATRLGRTRLIDNIAAYSLSGPTGTSRTGMTDERGIANIVFPFRWNRMRFHLSRKHFRPTPAAARFPGRHRRRC